MWPWKRIDVCDSGVDYVTGLVDVVVGISLPDDVAVDVDLHQARGCDLLIEQAIEIDQEVVLGAGNARRDVVIDKVGHPVFVYQAVAGSEFEPRLPFFVGYLALERGKVGGVVHGLPPLPRLSRGSYRA